jgi:hypothetical protein
MVFFGVLKSPLGIYGTETFTLPVSWEPSSHSLTHFTHTDTLMVKNRAKNRTKHDLHF